VWPAPPPLVSERTLRAAAKAPLPDAQDASAFGTPRTPPKPRSGALNQVIYPIYNELCDVHITVMHNPG
jgi:hypothetical protein